MRKFLLIICLGMLINLSAFAEENNLQYMNMDWWKNFNDEILTENLSKLYETNYDLKNAALKVKANEQIVKMQFAEELPGVNFSGEIARDFQAARKRYGNVRIDKYSQNQYYLPITAGYEVDIWGKNRLKTKSKKQQLEIIKQEERATYISLTSAFAADYFNLIKTDKLLELQKELVETQKNILDLTKDKYKIGLAPITDVLFQEKVLNTLKEEYNTYEKTREILENNLRVYLSQTGGEVKRSSFDKVTLINNIPEEYSTEIIQNRPDLREEEANLKRIGFDVRVARKEFLPTFTIYGDIGLNSYTVASLFHSPSQFLSAGIMPNFDLFAGGRKIAALKLEKFRYEEALNSYQKTSINAINEINSSLVDYKTAGKNYDQSLQKLTSDNKLYELAQDKRNIGNSNNLDVLLTKEVTLSTAKEEVSNKINTLVSLIGLYKTTGGVNLVNMNL